MEELHLTPKETKEAIAFYFERMPHLPILLCGPSGIGKTDISRQIARERNWDYLDIRLAGMLPEDLRGYPKSESWMDVQARYELKVGGPLYPELKFVLVDKLNTIFETEGPGLLYFEEINRAHPDVHQPIFQLIGDRAMDERVMGKEWRIIASINPDSDSKYIVNAMDMAFTRRWLFINIKPDIKSWLEYAKSKDFHPSVIKYLKENPNLLYKEVSEHVILMPAVWERISRMMFCFKNKKELTETGLMTLQLMMGKSLGQEFYRKAFEEIKDEISFEDVVNDYSTNPQIRKRVKGMVKNGEISDLTKLAQGVASTMDSWQMNTIMFTIDLPNDIAQILINAFNEAEVELTDPKMEELLLQLYAKMNEVRITE